MMIPVAEALARIRAGLDASAPVQAEEISLAQAFGRVLAEDLPARLTQPPGAVSAMDGWAVRAEDVASIPATLRRVGSIAAGTGDPGQIGRGEAKRIFTGALLPAGADTIVIQEDADLDGDQVRVREGAKAGTYVRPAGLDFSAGEVMLKAGTRLTARHVGLAAAMNHPWLSVRRRPRVAILPTGDEIVRPGDPLAPGQIVSSNALALAALVQAAGGEPTILGIARDEAADLRRLARGAAGADLLLTTGGASVGEHDLVRSGLAEDGLALDFWQIAMRPGKPLMFGRIGPLPMIGLPGNPVSSLVCALLFAVPAIEYLLGMPGLGPTREQAILGAPLPVNDRREDYIRATLEVVGAQPRVSAFKRQDSSMLSRLALADCLIVRAPHAPAAEIGESVDIIRLGYQSLPI